MSSARKTREAVGRTPLDTARTHPNITTPAAGRIPDGRIPEGAVGRRLRGAIPRILRGSPGRPAAELRDRKGPRTAIVVTKRMKSAEPPPSTRAVSPRPAAASAAASLLGDFFAR